MKGQDYEFIALLKQLPEDKKHLLLDFIDKLNDEEYKKQHYIYSALPFQVAQLKDFMATVGGEYFGIQAKYDAGYIEEVKECNWLWSNIACYSDKKDFVDLVNSFTEMNDHLSKNDRLMMFLLGVKYAEEFKKKLFLDVGMNTIYLWLKDILSWRSLPKPYEEIAHQVSV